MQQAVFENVTSASLLLVLRYYLLLEHNNAIIPPRLQDSRSSGLHAFAETEARLMSHALSYPWGDILRYFAGQVFGSVRGIWKFLPSRSDRCGFLQTFRSVELKKDGTRENFYSVPSNIDLSWRCIRVVMTPQLWKTLISSLERSKLYDGCNVIARRLFLI